jgi:GAF domain-containing protein
MPRSPLLDRLSLDALGLSQRASVIFVLASVVPLAVIAVLTLRYVVPQLPDPEARGDILAVVTVAALAILCFVVLARSTAASVAEIQAANARLQVLLGAARTLSETAFPDVIRSQAVRSALELARGAAGFLLPGCPESDAVTHPITGAGDAANRILTARRDALVNAAQAACQAEQGLLVGPQSAALLPGLLGPGEDGLVLASALVIPLVAHGRSFGVFVLLREAGALEFTTEESDTLLVLARAAASALHNADNQEAEQNFFTHVTEILVKTLDLHVDHQAGHARRVARYALQLGQALGLNDALRQRLFFAALLHDIGMLRVDPASAQTQEAFREHSRLADEMLAPITLWADLAPIVRHHHERFDGTGYPDRLAAAAIPLESRIIAVADTLDVLTGAGSYRPTVTRAEALAEIERCAGSQFDPQVVHALLSLGASGELEL